MYLRLCDVTRAEVFARLVWRAARVGEPRPAALARPLVAEGCLCGVGMLDAAHRNHNVVFVEYAQDDVKADQSCDSVSDCLGRPGK